MLGLTYGVQSGIPRSTMLVIGLISSALAILTQPFFAIAADRWGRKPVFVTGAVISAAATFLFFGALSTAATPAALIGSILMMPIGYSMCNAVIPALYAEMFDTRVRYTGVAVAGQLGQIFPGFAPAIAAGLIAGGGSGTSVAIFVAICAAISLATVLTARETKDVATEDLGGLRHQHSVAPAETVEAR